MRSRTASWAGPPTPRTSSRRPGCAGAGWTRSRWPTPRRIWSASTRLAIDRLRSAQARRESYVGPWLPEPLLTGPDVADDVALADTVSTAMLLILESLSPLERAVFVLREAFGYAYAEIGDTGAVPGAAARRTGAHRRGGHRGPAGRCGAGRRCARGRRRGRVDHRRTGARTGRRSGPDHRRAGPDRHRPHPALGLPPVGLRGGRRGRRPPGVRGRARHVPERHPHGRVRRRRHRPAAGRPRAPAVAVRVRPPAGQPRPPRRGHPVRPRRRHPRAAGTSRGGPPWRTRSPSAAARSPRSAWHGGT